MVLGREKLLSSDAEDEIGEEKDNDKGYSGEENHQPKVWVFRVANVGEGERVLHATLDAVLPAGGKLRPGDSVRQHGWGRRGRNSKLEQALREPECRCRGVPGEAGT